MGGYIQMSRASRHRDKEKKKIKAGMKLPIKCTKCGVPVPETIYEREDLGLEYQCPMCGNMVFGELMSLLEENSNFDLNAEVKKAREEISNG